MPLPGRLVNAWGSRAAAVGLGFDGKVAVELDCNRIDSRFDGLMFSWILRLVMCSITAWASGCSDLLSRFNMICKICVSVSCVLGKICISATIGLPWVRVPVLSNTMSVILFASSSACASLIRIPCLAPLPMPTIRAVGVASPSAHGQAIIRTLMKVVRANWGGVLKGKKHQKRAEITAMKKTVGTKMEEILSASF